MCALQKICGSCQFQHIKYDAQLKFKKEIVKDTLFSILGKEIEVNDVVPSPKTSEYRHKIQYPISETAKSKRILAGYYKNGTHELINIKHCTIQPEYCDKIIDFIRNNAPKYKISGYKESKHTGELRHVLIRTSALNNQSLIVLVVNKKCLEQKFIDFGEFLYNNLPNIAGVAVNFNNKKTNLILGDETKIIIGKSYIEEALCDKIFKISANTFFQVNPSTADNIFRYIKNYISHNFEKPSILDAYAGIAAFGIVLSDVASSVTSVEEVEESMDLADEIIRKNEIDNIKTICMDAGKCFSNMLNDGEQFDITILDPPRKGCSEESLNYALKLTKKQIIYVSCNPASLARDLKYLSQNGAEIVSIQPFDMFPHTYHIENVAIINLV